MVYLPCGRCWLHFKAMCPGDNLEPQGLTPKSAASCVDRRKSWVQIFCFLFRPFIKLKENGRSNISRSSSSTSSFSSTAGESETMEEYESLVRWSLSDPKKSQRPKGDMLIPPQHSEGMHLSPLHSQCTIFFNHPSGGHLYLSDFLVFLLDQGYWLTMQSY